MLTVFAIEKAKPRAKPYLLTDGNGLYLLVNPNGSKLWRLRYHFGGKQNMLGLGAFPTVSLAGARQRRNDARRLLADGIDPSQKRKDEKTAAEVTFGIVATEYIAKLGEEGPAESTISKNKWLLEDLASPLARRPVTEHSVGSRQAVAACRDWPALVAACRAKSRRAEQASLGDELC